MTKDSLKKQLDALFNGDSFLCAESVVRVIAEVGGKESDDAIRMATGFCSGMARTCGQCGAVSGALMGMGLYAGRSEPGADYAPMYAITQEFLDKFKSEYPSINCYELIGCDFATPEGQAKYKDENKREECLDFVVFAADTAISILREHGYLPEEKDFIKSRLAPCGLMCGKCVAFKDGPVQLASSELKAQLGDNFGEYAKRFEGMNPVFKNYPGFADLLDFLASGSCTSCRDRGCLFKDCAVTKCVRDKGVDYCFQCEEFPCERHGFPDRLENIWRGNNEKMKESGIGAWFRLCKDKPRYP